MVLLGDRQPDGNAAGSVRRSRRFDGNRREQVGLNEIPPISIQQAAIVELPAYPGPDKADVVFLYVHQALDLQDTEDGLGPGVHAQRRGKRMRIPVDIDAALLNLRVRVSALRQEPDEIGLGAHDRGPPGSAVQFDTQVGRIPWQFLVRRVPRIADFKGCQLVGRTARDVQDDLGGAGAGIDVIVNHGVVVAFGSQRGSEAVHVANSAAFQPDQAGRRLIRKRDQLRRSFQQGTQRAMGRTGDFHLVVDARAGLLERLDRCGWRIRQRLRGLWNIRGFRADRLPRCEKTDERPEHHDTEPNTGGAPRHNATRGQA